MADQLPPHIRTMNSMMSILPKPEKDGVVITIVGFGFGGDIVSENGNWMVTTNFKVSARYPPPNG